MTREQAKQNLISIGVAEPTDEQITNYLNQVSGETKKEKDKVAELKAKADKADELQTKINELEAGNLTEIEKANKALEEANKTIADMQKKMQSEISVNRLCPISRLMQNRQKKLSKTMALWITKLLEKLSLIKKQLPHRQKKKKLLTVAQIQAAVLAAEVEVAKKKQQMC